MKIYFTASTTNDGKLLNNFEKINSLIKKFGHEIISGEQIINKSLLEMDKKLSRQEIFEREKKLIEEADCVIAEVSQPSLGVGGEIVYALVNKKAVLGLLFENNEDKISPMIAGNPSDNFFFEHYSFNQLPYIIEDFLKHVESLKKRRGHLIVIDGGDGSGKTTQAKLLVEYLTQHKISNKYVDFPQYYSSFHGKTVARFLRGEFGKFGDVSPYLASLAFALDRASVKKEMEDYLSKGGYIIANRYATSNLAHQGAKFTDAKEREEFLKWLYELEYKVHKIPKEDLVIYLYVPWKIGLELTKKKGERTYLNGKTDIAEADINHRIASEKMYLELTKRYTHWLKIDCVENGKILSPQIIHERIINILKNKKLVDTFNP